MTKLLVRTTLQDSGSLVDSFQKLIQLVHVPVLQKHLCLPHLVVLQLGRLEDLPAAEERGGEGGE